MASVQVSNVAPSYAGEVGAKITRAVTTSDLGISIKGIYREGCTSD